MPYSESWCQTHIGVTEANFTWIISNFSFSTDNSNDSLESSVFWAPETDALKWRMQLYPNGNSHENNEYMSLFLQLVNCDKPAIKTDFRFCIIDKKDQETNERKTSEKWEFFQGRQSGFPKFVKREYIFNPANGLLNNDRLIIRCKIKCATGNIDNMSQNTEYSADVPKLLIQLSRDLDGLYKNDEFTDVILETEGGTRFPAHKIILAARSPVFAAMFAHNMRERQEGIVKINDIDADTMQTMLRFIYTGQVDDYSEDRAMKLLAVADKYAFVGLKEKCEQVLCKELSVPAAAEYLLTADLYNAKMLKVKSLIFIRAHLKEILDTPGFKTLSRTQPRLLEEILRNMM